jgi:tRNA(Ile)-lysidine synthase
MAKREETPAGEPRYRYVCNVPRAVQVETVCRIVAALGGQVSRSEAGRAADRLWRGDNASLGGVLATCAYEKLEGSPLTVRVWHFAPEPPRQTH